MTETPGGGQSISVRSEGEADAAAIEAVTLEAFRDIEYSDQTEHLIVRALRDSGDLVVSVVAVLDSAVVGHAAASPVSISDGSLGWFGLGPVSVTPTVQNMGIGSQLVREVLGQLQALSAAGCVVLGDSRYYRRFGFACVDGLVLPEVPPDHFMALTFGSRLPTGIVSYSPAFSVGR
ncbi:MAG: N-acetyltransferase [Actinomycetes bacterium]